MSLVEDGLIKSYYYYSGNNNVNETFLRTIIEKVGGYEYQGFIAKQRAIAKKYAFTEEQLYKKTYDMAISAAVSMCERVIKYREELKEHFKNNSGLRGGIKDSDIDEMKADELSKLRTNLGLSKRGKKVTKVEKAEEETIKKAKENLKEKKTSETAVDIMKSNAEFEQLTLDEYFKDLMNPEEPEEQEEFLYTSELQVMGKDDYSDAELRREGIVRLDEEKSPEDELIDTILDSGIIIDGHSITREELDEYSYSDLETLNNHIQAIINLYTKNNRYTK